MPQRYWAPFAGYADAARTFGLASRVGEATLGITEANVKHALKCTELSLNEVALIPERSSTVQVRLNAYDGFSENDVALVMAFLHDAILIPFKTIVLSVAQGDAEEVAWTLDRDGLGIGRAVRDPAELSAHLAPAVELAAESDALVCAGLVRSESSRMGLARP